MGKGESEKLTMKSIAERVSVLEMQDRCGNDSIGHRDCRMTSHTCDTGQFTCTHCGHKRSRKLTFTERRAARLLGF